MGAGVANPGGDQRGHAATGRGQATEGARHFGNSPTQTAGAHGEILPPRTTLRARLARDVFADENLDLLSHVLDDCFRLPGTSIRFGIDGLIGLVPFAGDVLAGLAFSLIVIAAWFRGVPAITLIRMVVNLGIGVVVGMIPLLGDAFDVAWKGNRRNYALLTRHLRQPNRHTWRDWVFLLLLGVGIVLILATPLVLLGLVLGWVMHGR